MAKTIETLVTDIYDVLNNPSDYDITEEKARLLGDRVTQLIVERMGSNKHSRNDLRMSNFGAPDRKVWYTINEPEKQEELPPEVRFKFMYGDLIELLTLWLAEMSGHSVDYADEPVEVHGVVGHRDAIIDGEVVDVKSASSYQMAKFRNNKIKEDDPFHYMWQLQLYLEASQDDDKVTRKDRGHFLAVDKTLGHIVLDTYDKDDSIDWQDVVTNKVKVVYGDTAPSRCYFPEKMGTKGNMKLGLQCSYCSFKQHCWPGLTGWAYANGPVFLTKVEEEPKVPRLF